MDINQLFSDHQLALMNADRTSCDEVRRIHFDRAGHYAGRVREYRDGLGLPPYRWRAGHGERRGDPYPERSGG